MRGAKAHKARPSSKDSIVGVNQDGPMRFGYLRPTWVVSQIEFCRDRRVSRRGMALTAFSSSNHLRLQMPYPVQESTFDVIELRQ